jgi:hypothetical protein
MRIEVDERNWASYDEVQKTIVVGLDGMVHTLSLKELSFGDIPEVLLHWGFIGSIIGDREDSAKKELESRRADKNLDLRRRSPEEIDPEIRKWTEETYRSLLEVDEELAELEEKFRKWTSMRKVVWMVQRSLDALFAVKTSEAADRRRLTAFADPASSAGDMKDDDGDLDMDNFVRELEEKL